MELGIRNILWKSATFTVVDLSKKGHFHVAVFSLPSR